MFESPGSRFALRTALFAVGATLSSLSGLVVADGFQSTDVLIAGSTGFTALLTYAGIGASFGSVEPFIGRQHSDPDVPVPPAEAEEPDTI
jgi:hypothetical protein